MAISSQALAKGLARQLSNSNIASEVVDSIAAVFDSRDELIAPIAADVCTIGICTDHILDGRDDLVKFIEEIGEMRGIGGVRIFPRGIINPERFVVQIDHIANRE